MTSQSVRDAINDAETLRIVAAEMRAFHAPAALRNDPSSIAAFNAAATCEWWLTHAAHRGTDITFPVSAEFRAADAFLACPGLREAR